MPIREFTNLQEALLFVFGPVIEWWLVMLVVVCAIIAILIPLFSTLRKINGGDQ